MSEYSSQELKDVWAEVLRVFNERHAGCTAREVAAATGFAEEVARACLEYLRQDGKVVRQGDVYAPDTNYVRDVVLKYAMEKVDEYLRKAKRATVDQIVSGIKDERGENIKREWVEEALRYLAGAGRVRYDQMTGEWVSLVRGA